jgi:folate-dependent phosphoribosylglycinamide formyltransferase PurN
VTAELRAAGETASPIGSIVPRGNGAAVRVDTKSMEEWCTESPSGGLAAEMPLRVGVLANGDGAVGTLMAIKDAHGLHLAGVALLHDSPTVEDFCAEQGIPCASCLVDQAAELLESFNTEAVIALNLPRSSLQESLCAGWRGRLLASVPSLSPFVTGVEDADDMIGLVVRTGSKFTGCTVFRVVENQPTLAGLPAMWPVAAQEIVSLDNGETAKSLRRKVDGRDCLGKAFVESLKTLNVECKRFRAESAGSSPGFIRSKASYNHFVAGLGNMDM